MSDVTVGFKIFGDASSFEKAIAKSYEATEKLEKRTKALGKIGKFAGEAAAGFGLVEVFDNAVKKAQALRDASIENGTAISANVKSLAAVGDQLDKIKEGAAKAGVELLGGISSFFDKIAKKYAEAKYGKDQVANGERAENGADAAEERLRQSAKIREERANIAKAKADDNGKINILLAEQLKIQEKINSGQLNAEEVVKAESKLREKSLEIATINKKIVDETHEAQKAYDAAVDDANIKNVSELEEIKNLKAQAVELDLKATFAAKDGVEAIKYATEAQLKRNAATAKGVELAKSQAEKQKGLNDQQHNVDKAQKKLGDAVADRSKLSLTDLAALGDFTPGVSIKTGQDARQAREALDLEKQANDKRLSGDAEGAAGLFSQADKIREGLGGAVKSTDAEVFKELKENLKEQIDKLEELKVAFEGKFIAQP